MKNKPLIIITGPTGSGKSRLSVLLAHRIGGSVVSADSMQIYRGMDIGTAKVTPEETDGIPHYLIDIMDPEESYDVTRFKAEAKKAIEDIYSKGRIPIICGGTGFYIQALLYDIEFDEEGSDPSVRKRLEDEYDSLGAEAMFERLRQADPASCEIIHPNNKKRIVRAMEFFETTKSPISEHNKTERARTAAYDHAFFALNMDRAILYEKIDKRVDEMMEAGLLEEAKELYDRGLPRENTAMQAIGYKQLFSYFDGEIPLDEALRLIKRDSRHYAKRQFTWLGRERDVIWLEREKTDDEILADIGRVLEERNIL